MTGGPTGQPRPLEWIGSSKKDLMALPAQVVDVFGYALYLAQTGERHDQAKPLRGFGSRGRAGSGGRLAWRRLSRGLHRPVHGAGVRAACISEEVEAWHSDAEGGHGFDQREIEGRGCAG